MRDRRNGLGFHGEGADVEAALCAGRGPRGEIGLRGDVGHLELHVGIQRRNIAAHVHTHPDAGHQRLFDIESHPHIAHVEDRHHRVTAADQFALLGDDRRDLARDGRVDHCVAEIRFHLADGSFGLTNTGRSGLLVLLAGPVRRHVVLRLGGQRRRLHSLVVGRGFVELLGGHYPVVIKVLHTFEGLAGQFQPRLRLLPHVQRGLDLLDARTGYGGSVQGCGGALHGLGLLEFGVQLGRRERVEQLPFLHAVALGDFHVVDASRDLRRGFVGGTFHRALNQHRGPFGEVPADQYDREDDDRGGR